MNGRVQAQAQLMLFSYVPQCACTSPIVATQVIQKRKHENAGMYRQVFTACMYNIYVHVYPMQHQLAGDCVCMTPWHSFAALLPSGSAPQPLS